MNIDERIAREVMGWPTITNQEPYRLYQDKGGVVHVAGNPAKFNRGCLPIDWSPSERIADAMDVLEKLRSKGWHVSIAGHPTQISCLMWWCEISKAGPSRNLVNSQRKTAGGDTVQAAICAAVVQMLEGRK